MRILVVDDEKLLVKGLKFNLENDGYEVDGAYDGREALMLFEKNKYDLVLLDLMLPEISGLEVCRAIREKSNVPVIMVTAKTEGIDKLIGFEYGADDYVTKPYDILELKARIRVILKRVMTTSQAQKKAEQAEIFESETLKINFKNRSVVANGREVDLTAKEFDLLSIFIKNPAQVFSRDKLLELGWGKDYPGDNRTVDVHIRKIREKIEEDDANPKIILTKWGVGYYFKG
ncbi:MAG: response regulator transcription factor [Ruminococcaceae bacterium]|nr:response regulator transcription factor [Oscillospiraceae bacterium]